MGAGWRKFALGLIYTACCTTVNMTAILTAPDLTLADLAGLAALDTGMATGLGVVVWGNVQTHRVHNGGPK